MANMSLGLQKYSVKPGIGIPLKTIPVNPKISVIAKYGLAGGQEEEQPGMKWL